MVHSLQSNKKLALLIVIFSLAGLFLNGCASKYGPQTTVVNHYPDCYQPIAEIRASEFMVEESTVAGVVVGALAGALIGYAAGGGRGAVVGGTMGAVTGGIIANQYARIAQERDDLLRLQYYSLHLEETVQGMDATTAAAKVARQCYERQFEVAVAEFQNGHISREQFQSRFTEVSSGLEEASRVLGMTIDSVAEVSTAYENALAQESERLNVDAATLAAMHREALRNSQRAQAQEQARQQQAAKPRRQANLAPEVDSQLGTMVDSGAQLENSLDNARAERDLINARLDLANRMADDLLSFNHINPAVAYASR